MAINFKEEEIERIYQVHRSALEEISQYTRTVADSIGRITERTKYEKIVELFNGAMQYYNEELKNVACNTLNEWAEGESSFVSALERVRAGESAKNKAIQVQNTIIEEIHTWGTMEEITVDTAEVDVKSEDFQEICDSISQYNRELEELYKSKQQEITANSEENTLYGVMNSVVLPTITTVASGFGESTGEAFQKLAEEFQLAEQEVHQQAADFSQNVQASKSAAKTAGELLKQQVSTMFT
ncbi:MAG: hypothetical protein R3Y54_01970 [Eubacteriales bacterium]